jgi:hypothetical protein
MAPPSPPRAAGVRLPFAGLPPRIVDWVEAELGSQVIHAANQVGGMSPGCATRLLMADDSRSFLKAVGSGLNPRTPELFRHEIAVLSALKQAPYRASLLLPTTMATGLRCCFRTWTAAIPIFHRPTITS